MQQNDHGRRDLDGADGAAGTGASAAHGPLDCLAREHVLQLEVCEALEHIADDLPGRVDLKLVCAVINVLQHGLTGHFRFEEEVLFPRLRERAGADVSLAAALDQLQSEHARDGDLCHELAEELKVLSVRGEPRNADMLAYMLRGFFEGQRRHIEWENSIVLPAARRVLSEQDLQGLARYAEQSARKLPSLKALPRGRKRPRLPPAVK